MRIVTVLFGLASCCVLSLTAPGGARADDAASAAVALNASPAGALLGFDRQAREWKPLAPHDAIKPGQELTVLAGERAQITAHGGGVRLTLWGNVSQALPNPLQNAAVVVENGGKDDLAFHLMHGRVVATNHRDNGASRIRVRFNDQTYTLNLTEPGTEVAIEHYSRWPRGIPFVVLRANAKGDTDQPRPLVSVVILVLKGRADLNTGQEEFGMRAPPGPAAFAWDNFRGAETSPRRVNAIPLWAKKGDLSAVDPPRVLLAVKEIRQAVTEKPVTQVLTDALSSENQVVRDLAVEDMAAVSDLPGLLRALTDKQHQDVRMTAVEALQRWIGRGSTEDQRLFRFLRRESKFSPAQAEITMQLMHSFDRAAWFQPETYEMLIGYLDSPQMAIRVLAAAHLYGPSAPNGAKKITYDPAGNKQERSQAVAQWRKLIPEGTIPKDLQKPKK